MLSCCSSVTSLFVKDPSIGLQLVLANAGVANTLLGCLSISLQASSIKNIHKSSIVTMLRSLKLAVRDIIELSLDGCEVLNDFIIESNSNQIRGFVSLGNAISDLTKVDILVCLKSSNSFVISRPSIFTSLNLQLSDADLERNKIGLIAVFSTLVFLRDSLDTGTDVSIEQRAVSHFWLKLLDAILDVDGEQFSSTILGWGSNRPTFRNFLKSSVTGVASMMDVHLVRDMEVRRRDVRDAANEMMLHVNAILDN